MLTIISANSYFDNVKDWIANPVTLRIMTSVCNEEDEKRRSPSTLGIYNSN
jgi:hypothetical protein